jgi:hypothetical protein
MSLPCGSIFPGSGVERPERRRWQGHEGEQRARAGRLQPERAAWQRTVEQEHGGCSRCDGRVFVGVLEQGRLLRTTPSRAIDETHFFLVYGAKAALRLQNAHMDHHGCGGYDEDSLRDQRIDDIGFLEDIRCQVAIWSAWYQQRQCCYHSYNFRPWELEVGDPLLRRLQSAKGANKLSPRWRGACTAPDETPRCMPAV